jgi:acylphosphatase
MSSFKIIRVRAVVSGRVQGVGFRFFVIDAARSLNIKGWVRNLHTGEVEAVLEGEERAVHLMIQQLKTGPRLSRVQDVGVFEEVTVPGEFAGFDVRY